MPALTSSFRPPTFALLAVLTLALTLASCHSNEGLRRTTSTSQRTYPKTVPADDAPLFPGLRKAEKRTRIATRDGERRPFTRGATATTSKRERRVASHGASAKTRRALTPAPPAPTPTASTTAEPAGPRVRSYASEEERLRKDVERVAESYVGIPYHYGGTTTDGFDCSGYTRHVMREFGIQLNRVSMSQAKQGRPVNPKHAKPGDLVYFANADGRVNHIGIVVANGREGLEMVHASSSRGIVRDNVNRSDYWSGRLAGARCVVECRGEKGVSRGARR